ncbi:hypothetical protein C8R47DRAFT_1224516 [Mycena vitilis]|nr:hypothetical protein C8R47DRAFT_1224516 [Mycena vitilis]
MSVVVVTLSFASDALLGSKDLTFEIPLNHVYKMSRANQIMSFILEAANGSEKVLQVSANIAISATVSLFPDVAGLRRYTAIKEMATSYIWNSRGLEEHWRTAFAELFRAILPQHLIVQEEGTLWTFTDTTKNPSPAVALDKTMPLGSKAGSWKRPDVRVIHFLDGRPLFPILVENKKAISRQHSTPESGWPCTLHGRTLLLSSLSRAIQQAEWQAALLFRFDSASGRTDRQSEVFLIAAVGPLYVTALVSRSEIDLVYHHTPVDTIQEMIAQLDDMEHLERRKEDEAEALNLDLAGMVPECDTFSRTEVTRKSGLPGSWSTIHLLDTPMSDRMLSSIATWQYLYI